MLSCTVTRFSSYYWVTVKQSRSKAQENWIQTELRPLTNCVILSKLRKLTVPLFPQLQGDGNRELIPLMSHPDVNNV